MSGAVLHRARAERVLAEVGADALVATTYQNVFYVSGYRGFAQLLNPFAQVHAVARADRLDEPVLVAPLGDLDLQAMFPASGVRLRPYGEFPIEPPATGAVLTGELDRYRTLAFPPATDRTAADALVGELDRLPPSSRIAVDERGIDVATWERVRTRFGERIVPGAAILQRIRMVKTHEEVRRLEAATHAIESSYLAALAAAAEGVSELDLACALDAATVGQGSVPYFTVLAFGERSALPNAQPSPDRRLAPGDLIRFDIGCTTELYRSDIARCAVLGEAAPAVRRAYDAILAGEERMLELMRPGALACDVFDAAVTATRDAGLPGYRRHHVGHGIGLDVYDGPLLAPGDRTALEPGMVFEIETPYYELGLGGVQVEDTVVITEDGHRVLTGTARGLQRV